MRCTFLHSSTKHYPPSVLQYLDSIRQKFNTTYGFIIWTFYSTFKYIYIYIYSIQYVYIKIIQYWHIDPIEDMCKQSVSCLRDHETEWFFRGGYVLLEQKKTVNKRSEFKEKYIFLLNQLKNNRLINKQIIE